MGTKTSLVLAAGLFVAQSASAENAPAQGASPKPAPVEQYVSPKNGNLAWFNSTPAGVSVLIDHQLLCTTPCHKKVAPGSHEVSMQKESFETLTKTMAMTPSVQVVWTLVEKYGELVIETEPPALPITLNGKAEGVSPIDDKKTDPGAYDITVQDSCWLPVAEHVEVRRGQSRTVKIEAHPRAGTVKVTAELKDGQAVDGADVIIDGKAAGTAPGTFSVGVCVKELEVSSRGRIATVPVTVTENAASEVTAVLPVQAPTGEMVYIKGGSFLMGSNDGEDDESPVTLVRLDPFYLGVSEVSTALYSACVDAHKCTLPINRGWCNWGIAGKEDHPINCVDWKQAKTFCEWAGARLPTEAEWEFAARGVDKREYPWGKAEPDAQHANFGQAWEGARGTDRVDSTPDGATPTGVLNLSGNVAEWVEDAYAAYSGKNATNPRQETGQGRVVRGGSWNDPASDLRAAKRSFRDPKDRVVLVGFRCARSAAKTPGH